MCSDHYGSISLILLKNEKLVNLIYCEGVLDFISVYQTKKPLEPILNQTYVLQHSSINFAPNYGEPKLSVLQYEDYHSLPTDRKILWSKALCEFCFCTRKASLKIIFISLVVVNGLREGRRVRDTLQRTSLHWQEVGRVCWNKDRKGKGYPAFSKFCSAPISL